MRGEGRKGHFVYDGGEEGRERGEGDVAAEEHEGGEVAFWVRESLADFAPVKFRFWFFFLQGSFLLAGFDGETECGDAFFAASEEARAGRAVGDLVPGDNGGDDAGGAFNEEEEAPGGDRDVLAGFCD